MTLETGRDTKASGGDSPVERHGAIWTLCCVLFDLFLFTPGRETQGEKRYEENDDRVSATVEIILGSYPDEYRYTVVVKHLLWGVTIHCESQ